VLHPGGVLCQAGRRHRASRLLRGLQPDARRRDRRVPREALQLVVEGYWDSKLPVRPGPGAELADRDRLLAK
jgi:hypothetical protein